MHHPLTRTQEANIYAFLAIKCVIFSMKMLLRACVCYSLAKCKVNKMREREKYEDDAVRFYMKVFNGSRNKGFMFMLQVS